MFILICQETLKINYERKSQEDLNRLSKNKNCEIEKLKQKLDMLQKNIDTITQQHDEALLRAENDKQQTLLLGKLFMHSKKSIQIIEFSVIVNI